MVKLLLIILCLSVLLGGCRYKETYTIEWPDQIPQIDYPHITIRNLSNKPLIIYCEEYTAEIPIGSMWTTGDTEIKLKLKSEEE